MKAKMWILLSLLIWARLCSAADSPDPVADGAAEPAINMLRDTWIERLDKLQGRTIITHRTTILKELLDQQPTNVINAAIGRVCHKEIAPDVGAAARTEEGFDAVLLTALVDWAVDKHDRVTLVGLLRHNCPRVVEQLMPPEFYVATQWPGSITSLFEAYETAATTSAKKDLPACFATRSTEKRATLQKRPVRKLDLQQKQTEKTKRAGAAMDVGGLGIGGSDEYERRRTCQNCRAVDSKKLLRRPFKSGGSGHAVGCRTRSSPPMCRFPDEPNCWLSPFRAICNQHGIPPSVGCTGLAVLKEVIATFDSHIF